MNDMSPGGAETYYREAESWSADREQSRQLSLRTAWIVASVAAAIAFLEAIAIVTLLPLKTVEPYTLLVDRQTGHVQALKPLDKERIAPDTALTRSFLAQYVIARESFDIDTLNQAYRKVALWSVDDARSRYVAGMQASNPMSPLASLPRRALVDVAIRSVSSLKGDTSLIRFSTTRRDPGGQPQPPQLWAATIKYRFSNADMTADDRLTNPLGFQVVRYRRDAEVLPETVQPATVLTQPVAPATPATAPPVTVVR